MIILLIGMFSFLYGIDHNINPVQGSAGIATVSTIADKDSYVIDLLPLGNYGSEEDFWVMWDLTILMGKRTAFLHFPFTDKPDNVIKVEIRIYFKIQYDPIDIQIFTVNVDWEEDTINWFNAPIGETFILKDEISENGFYTFDVTDFIQGEDGFSILIHDPTINNANWLIGSSREGPANKVPRLIWTYETPPTNPKIKINNNAEITNSKSVNLTLSANDADEMCFKYGTGAWTSWEPYKTSKNIYLIDPVNNSEYTICVKFSNSIGESNIANDGILYIGYLPTNPQIQINDGAQYTLTSLVNVSIFAKDAEEMCFSNFTAKNWSNWEPYNTTKKLFLAGTRNRLTYSIYAKFRNEAGEILYSVNDSIQIIYSQPFNAIIKINNGSDNTYSMFITLDITAELAQEMCFRNGTDGVWTSWEPYNTTKNLYLEGSEDGKKYSIYAKFRNIFGETQPKSDDIIYTIHREFWNNEINIGIEELNIILTFIFFGGLVIIAIMVKKGR